MAVELVIQPGRVMTKEEFKTESAQQEVGTIALDGAVHAEPFTAWVANSEGEVRQIFNFDHHVGVNRATCPATCEQVMDAMDAHAFDGMTNKHGEMDAKLYINDGDHDVCAAVAQFLRPDYMSKSLSGVWRDHIRVEGSLDRTCGAYPENVTKDDLMENAWVYAPYNEARVRSEHMSEDPEVLREIIMEVVRRIGVMIEGRAERAHLDMRYELVEKGSHWAMIRDIGALARMGATRDGHKTLISLRDKNPGRIDMTLWRAGLDVPFDIPRVTAALNQAELRKLQIAGLVDKSVKQLNPSDAWGGNPVVAGSPRLRGTLLSPEEVAEIAEEFTV